MMVVTNEGLLTFWTDHLEWRSDRRRPSDGELGKIRKVLRQELHAWLHREGHPVDRRANTLKPFRRIFSRFDRLDCSCVGFVRFVCALMWVRLRVKGT